MVFASPVFLFVFFTLFFGLYYLLPGRLRIAWLLLSSLFFYAWGEPVYVLLMVAEIAVVWQVAAGMEKCLQKGHKKGAGWLFALGLSSVLGVLLYFKYSGLFLESLKNVFSLKSMRIEELALPVGISFYSFQALSYLVDVWRGSCPAQKNPFLLGTYITMFPQLIAGPIVRYDEVSVPLGDMSRGKRIGSVEAVKEGLQRFIIGLSKKILLANTIAAWSDLIWANKPDKLSAPVVWFAAILYAFQIYYDFSGYSDMAIGLGRMMGFRFPENFCYPYIALSARDFWRRWHLTLSRWFRDYVYIPLGGSRRGLARTMRNLLIVFILCGLWHGASWNFAIWGLYWGLFLALERIPAVGKLQKKLPAPLRWLLNTVVILVGWVLFRSTDLARDFETIAVMFGKPTDPAYSLMALFSMKKLVILTCAVLGMFPWVPGIQKVLEKHNGIKRVVNGVLVPILLLVLLSLCIMQLAAGTFNPFIYFRF